MTLTHRFTIALVSLIAALGLTVGVALISRQVARADAPDYVVFAADKPVKGDAQHPYRDTLIAQADTGSGSDLAPAMPATGSAATAAPADKLHDPVGAPGAAWDDLKAAKKVGWPLAVFAGLIMLCKLLARLKRYKLLARLGTGKVAVVIGALGALGAACYNAAAEGGAWTAMMVAGVTAIGHYLDAGGKS